MRFKMYQLTPDSLSYIVGRRCFQLKGESSRTPFGSRNRLEESVTLGCRIERPLPFEPRSRVSPSRNRENQSLVFGSGCQRRSSIFPSPPSNELPLISCALPSPRVSFSYPFLSPPRFFRRYVSHSIFSRTNLPPIPDSTTLPPSPTFSYPPEWFKWCLSALLEAVEEARLFRFVSSRTPILSGVFFPISFSLFSSHLFLDLLL